MDIISLASDASCWRGLDYYKKNKIINLKRINDYEYTSTAIGTNNYDIYLDVSHPRRSTCNCPLANGKRIICKHIVATFFTALPEEAKNFEEEQERLHAEYEDYQEKLYNKTIFIGIPHISEPPRKEYIKREKMIMNMEYSIITNYIKLRKNAKISQEQLANETNVIRTTIARIENNMNSPQLKTMLELLEPLGYTLEIVPIKK